MGSNQGNYSQQIDTALNQANQPKSDFAKEFSGTIQGSYLPILSGLLNAGMLGNAFPGMQSGAQTPGYVFNRLSPTSSSGGAGIATNGISLPPGINMGPEPTNPVGPYTGKLNYSYQDLFNKYGIDPSQFPANTSLGDLVKQGKLTSQQMYNYFDPTGNYSNYDPSKDPNQTQQYQDWLSHAQNSPLYNNPQNGNTPIPDFNSWYNTYGLPGTQIGFKTPENQQDFQNYLRQVKGSSIPSGGWIDDQGNYILPSDQKIYLQNGQYRDANGNNLGPAPSSGGGGGNGGVDFSGLNSFIANLPNPAGDLLNNPRFSQTYSQLPGLGIPGLANALQSQLNTQTGTLNGGIPNVNPSLTDLSSITSPINPQDSAYYKGLSDVLQNQVNQGRADLRARFGAGGGTSRGTPASYAESQYDSQVLPQLASTLGQARQQEVGNTLQQRQQILSGLTSNSQLGTNTALQNVQNLLSGQNNLTQSVSNLGQLMLGGQGLQSQNYLGTIGANQQGNSLLAQLAQLSGSQQGNYLNMLQSANQAQIQNSFAGLQGLAQIIAQLALSGIPGGSANVNLGANSQSGTQQVLGALGRFA